jgi:hypothetical protein
MSGPKPLPSIAFRDLYLAVEKLRNASENRMQETIIENLLAGLKQVEPQWNVTRLPNGVIDTRRPILAANSDA